MKINIEFINGNNYWQDKVRASAEHAGTILSDAAFLMRVRSWPLFDYCADKPTVVADMLVGTPEVTIRVGFYKKWLTRAIAYEQDGAVYFNVCKEGRGAGSPGNVAHEVMHAPPFGYKHNGNSPAGNQHTVPYAIGQWIDDWAEVV